MAVPDGTDDLSVEALGLGGEGGTGPEETTPAAPASTEQTPADNPEWQTYKDKLGEIQYENIKPLLKENDLRVQRLVQKTRDELSYAKKFEPYKDMDPQRLDQLTQIGTMLETDPYQFYKIMADHPAIKAELEKVTGTEIDTSAAADIDPDAEVDPVVQQLQNQVQALVAQQELQTQAQMTEKEQREAVQADMALSTELTALRAAHPGLDDQDVNEIEMRAYIIGQQTGRTPALEDIAKTVEDRWAAKLNQPRASASAPLTMPTNGGTPSSAQQTKTPGQMTDSEVQTLIADSIRAGRS